MSRFRCFLLLAALFPALSLADEPLTIAVASNFVSAAEEVISEFTKATGIPVRLSSGSTGKLYAQIVNGAPYDIFLAADRRRPALLEEQGHTIAGTRRTYAIGSLVLWSADDSLQGQDCRVILSERAYKHLAIANPATAPYGLAAKEFLISVHLWDEVSERVVFGESISQTLQFVATRNATLGLVATSQLNEDLLRKSTCYWKVPTTLHSAITQQAVAIDRSRNSNRSMQFLRFLHGPEAAEVLRRRGYEVPE